jgi:hypothetical protein
MADVLLAARGHNPPTSVGKTWVSQFVDSQLELQTEWNRKFHFRRAGSEDPAALRVWFDRVQKVRLAYGMLDQEIYNFDETGFSLGVVATSKVITSSDRVSEAVAVQPGKREWVTSIEAVNAASRVIPPFLILRAKRHQQAWYTGVPGDWAIAFSNNGWTADQLGHKWIQHFNKHTASRTVGTYRLLVLDGYSSHRTPEFDQY